tara:strand:- start:2330 stop:2599 length:270 start_codon:yes stop_codon:yes gene_type:complete
MTKRNPLFVVLRIVLILIFSINSGNFELNPMFDNILNKNRFTKFLSLFFLTLSLVISINERVSFNDILISLAATGLFIIIAKPRDDFHN